MPYNGQAFNGGDLPESCQCAACQGLNRIEVGNDAVFYGSIGGSLSAPGAAEASVDGDGGEIRGKPVYTVEEVAYYLNRGVGVQEYEGNFYNSGANWDGAQGTANNEWYWVNTSKNNGGQAVSEGQTGGPGAIGPLTTLNFGFYETLETLPDPYVYTQAADGTSQTYFGMEVTEGFSTFDADQRAAAREAIEAWDELILVDFAETSFEQGDINFMNTTTGPIQASAYLPYDYGDTTVLQDDGTFVSFYEISGDVYINPDQATNHQFDEGQYGLTTLIHEIGHALGLEHPGDYNFGPGFDVSYDNGAEYYQDSNQYSIMSYWDAEETGAKYVNWEFLTYSYSSTANVHDIAAIQRIYGADTTTRNGDTVYGFNTTEAANGTYDLANNLYPVFTIWDTGGEDTLDLSGYDTPSVIDLTPGEFSSAGGFQTADIPTLDEINARRVAAGMAERTQGDYDLYMALFADTFTDGLLKDNISIAYNVVVENAVGGNGDDIIKGNNVANILDGGNGDDVLEGQLGADTLIGGYGSDTASYETMDRRVNINLNTGQTELGAFGDTLNGIENLTGSAFNDFFIGSSGQNTLDGGAGNDRMIGGLREDVLVGGAGHDRMGGNGHNDTLYGNEGNDFLSGGLNDDILVGGSGYDRMIGEGGNDTFVFLEADALDSIFAFETGADTIDLTALNVDSSDVAISGIHLYVNTDGAAGYDLHVLVWGDQVQLSDIVFTNPVI